MEYVDQTAEVGKVYRYFIQAVHENGDIIAKSNEVEFKVLDDMKISTAVSLTGDTEVGNLTIEGGSLNLNGYKLTVYGDLDAYNTTINMNKGYLYCVGDAFIRGYVRLKFVNINDYMRVDGLLKWKNVNIGYALLEKGTLELHGDLEYDATLNLSNPLFQVQLNGDYQQNIIQPNISSRTAIGNLGINNHSEGGIYSNLPLYIINLERNGCKISYENMQDYNYGWTLSEDQVIEGDLYLAEDTLDLNGHQLTVKGNLIQASGKININAGSLVVEGNYLQQFLYQEANTVKAINSTGFLVMQNDKDQVYIKGDYYNDTIVNSTDYLTKGKMTVEGDITVTNASAYGFVAQNQHTLILSGNKEQKIVFPSTYDRKENSGLAHLRIEKNNEGSVSIPAIIVKEGYQSDGMAYEGCLYLFSGAIQSTERVNGNAVLMEATTISNELEVEGDLTVNQPIVLEKQLTVHGNMEVREKGELNLNGHTLHIKKNLAFFYRYSNSKQLIMNHGSSHLIVDKDLNLEGIYGTLNRGVVEVKGNVTQGGSYAFIASNAFKLLLSGEALQRITVKHPDTNFNIIEVVNTSKEGIYSDTQIPYNQLILNGNKITYGNNQGVLGWTLEDDQVYEGDLILMEDTLDLNGHTLRVKGNLIQAGGTIKINNGCLIIDEDYRIQTIIIKEDKVTYGLSYGTLLMNEEQDLVQVKGSFISSCGLNNTTRLTEGRFEVAGDFILNNITQNMFTATENHTIVFNGEHGQTVNLAQTSHSNSRFSNIVFANESAEGITIINPIAIGGIIEEMNTKITGRIKPFGEAIFNTEVFSGDVEISDNDYSFKGDISFGGSLYVSRRVYLYGKLRVKGDCHVYRNGELNM